MKLNILCPACSGTIPRSVLKNLNPFWMQIRVIVCPNCRLKLQWHSPLHKRMVIGGRVFASSLIVVLMSAPLFFIVNVLLAKFVLSIGILGILVGFLSTKTRPEDLKLEVVDGA